MPLSDTNLLVRYYFDEAASGTSPTQVNDSSGNDYHLTDLSYGSTMNWTADGNGNGNRGLESTTIDQGVYAKRAIDNSTPDFFASAIDTGSKFTVEIVYDHQTGSTNNARIFCLNDKVGNAPILGLSDYTGQTGPLRCWFYDGSSYAYGAFATPSSGRKVMHMVVDTTLATGDDRIKFYVDGVQQTLVVAVNPSINSTGSFASSTELIVFNRDGGSDTYNRSPAGTIYYGAIYDDAFDATRVSDHYDVLSVNDDALAQVIDATTITWASGNNPPAQDITVPADCAAVVMLWSFYQATDGVGLLSTTLAGASPDHSIEYPVGISGQTNAVGVAVWLNPSAGTRALDVAWDVSPSEGPVTTVCFISHCSDVRSSDAYASSGSNTASFDLTTVVGDLVIKLDTHYDESSTPPNLGTGWTNLVTQDNVNDVARTSYRRADGTTTSCAAEATLYYSSLAALAFVSGEPAAGLTPSTRIARIARMVGAA